MRKKLGRVRSTDKAKSTAESKKERGQLARAGCLKLSKKAGGQAARARAPEMAIGRSGESPLLCGEESCGIEP